MKEKQESILEIELSPKMASIFLASVLDSLLDHDKPAPPISDVPENQRRFSKRSFLRCLYFHMEHYLKDFPELSFQDRERALRFQNVFEQFLRQYGETLF